MNVGGAPERIPSKDDLDDAHEEFFRRENREQERGRRRSGKTRNDEESQVPAKEDELDDWDTDEHVPAASGREVPASAEVGVRS